MQTLREVGRTLKLLFKPSIFGLGPTQQLSISPNLLFVLASGYINTVKQFLFPNHYELHFIANVSDKRQRSIERFDVFLTSLSSSSDENYKRVDMYTVDDKLIKLNHLQTNTCTEISELNITNNLELTSSILTKGTFMQAA